MPLLDILRAQNEWWSTGKVPSVLLKDIKRIEFEKAIGQIDDERILGMIGPRRTGKTTILYQLINKILENTNPERILFFSADDPALLPFKDNLFENIIKTFFEDVLLESKRGEKVYIFIDELHFLADWELWLKKYYDLKYNIKFIISSSSAIHIQRKYTRKL
ncbi:MAG: AAA family ATPase [Candidatus Methanoperedens sp.]|nr:AAA family ATPase [Candidatus Methanoperedens sp.]